MGAAKSGVFLALRKEPLLSTARTANLVFTAAPTFSRGRSSRNPGRRRFRPPAPLGCTCSEHGVQD